MSKGIEKMFDWVCWRCGKEWNGSACDHDCSDKDMVNNPPHYAESYPFETKDAIKLLLDTYAIDLTPYQCGCLFNELKYRLRAGFKDKDKIQEDIDKALFYNKERKRVDSDSE